MNPAWFILMAVGVFSLAGVLFNCDWFMNTGSPRELARAIRPVGTRVFYIVLGIIVPVFGVLYQKHFSRLPLNQDGSG